MNELQELEKIRIEAYQYAIKLVDDKIHNWRDLYDMVESVYWFAIHNFDPVNSITALSFQHAYFLAMRELPEEGDCQIIAKKLFSFLTIESDRLLGSTVKIEVNKQHVDAYFELKDKTESKQTESGDDKEQEQPKKYLH